MPAEQTEGFCWVHFFAIAAGLLTSLDFHSQKLGKVFPFFPLSAEGCDQFFIVSLGNVFMKSHFQAGIGPGASGIDEAPHEGRVQLGQFRIDEEYRLGLQAFVAVHVGEPHTSRLWFIGDGDTAQFLYFTDTAFGKPVNREDYHIFQADIICPHFLHEIPAKGLQLPGVPVEAHFRSRSVNFVHIVVLPLHTDHRCHGRCNFRRIAAVPVQYQPAFRIVMDLVLLFPPDDTLVSIIENIESPITQLRQEGQMLQHVRREILPPIHYDIRIGPVIILEIIRKPFVK